MIVILLFSINKRLEVEKIKKKLKERLNLLFWIKFHVYGNKSIKKEYALFVSIDKIVISEINLKYQLLYLAA